MSGARVRCHRCGVWIGVIDWSDPMAATVADRIVAAHAVECIPPRAKPTCKEPDCDRPRAARGWCKTHWNRWRRTGNPRGRKTNKGEVRLEPLPTAPAKVVPPEPAVTTKRGVKPAVCRECGRAYAADAGLPDALLRAALVEHKRRCGRAA